VAFPLSTLEAMHENRRAVVGLCGTVSLVTAAFAGIVASRSGAVLSQNPLFIVCIAVAVVAFVILLVAGYPDLRDWLRTPRAPQASTVPAVFEASERAVDPPAAATSPVEPTAATV
jgi:hypothetical protein